MPDIQQKTLLLSLLLLPAFHLRVYTCQSGAIVLFFRVLWEKWSLLLRLLQIEESQSQAQPPSVPAAGLLPSQFASTVGICITLHPFKSLSPVDAATSLLVLCSPRIFAGLTKL